eukprot:gene10289-13832_t
MDISNNEDASTQLLFGKSNNELSETIRSIYSQGYPFNKVAICVTGGGVQALSWLFTEPGASSTMLSANVPYAMEALDRFVFDKEFDSFNESKLTKYCCEDTAREMAKAAYCNAIQNLIISKDRSAEWYKNNILGVACTAALATNRVKKDSYDRCFIAIHSKTISAVYNFELVKGVRTRVEEDEFCSKAIIDAIALQCGLQLPSYSALYPVQDNLINHSLKQLAFTSSHNIIAQSYPHSDSIEKLYSRSVSHVLFYCRNDNNNNDTTNGKSDSTKELHEFDHFEDIKVPSQSIVYSGSFNPLHEGHVELVKAELDRINIIANGSKPNHHPLVVFEIAAINADKPPLSREEILKRISQFQNNPLIERYGITNYAVSITTEPFFTQKSKLFKNCKFIVGVDTFARIINPKYYANKDGSGDKDANDTSSLMNMIVSLSVIKHNGCNFIVGGRVVTDSSSLSSKFVTVDSILAKNEKNGLRLPNSIIALFDSLSEEQFRKDISSTDIRNKKLSSG